MTITNHTTITYTDDDTGVTVELPFMPYDGEVHVSDDGKDLAFIIHDPYGWDSWEWPEGVIFRDDFRSADSVDDWIESIDGNTHDVFVVGCYEHGSVSYCVHGDRHYPDMQWDYRASAMIAIPRDYTNTRDAANIILDEYSSVCNGETYIVVNVNVDDPDNYEACGGYVGYNLATGCAKAGW
jgi:hypothetical protein